VVGGGLAAAEEALFLTTYARKVTVIVRKADFSCAQSIADKVKQHEKIEVLYHTVMEEVRGDTALRTARLKNTATGESWEYKAPEGESFGVFVFAGYTPETALVKGLIDLDESGYVVTDEDRKTSAEGVYAAGDVCIKRLRQVVTATADGAVAATELEHHAQRRREATGLVPTLPVAAGGVAGAGAGGAADAGTEGAAGAGAGAAEGLITDDMRAQLAVLFERMAEPLELRLYLDDRPVSTELAHYMDELSALTDKLSCVIAGDGQDAVAAGQRPCVRLFKGGADTGLAFHGVPGGHEFNSFVLGLYNASGPGQQLDDDARARIAALARPTAITVLVSLSCTMCPDAVVAAQHIAALSPLVQADVYDIAHFADLKQTYQVMSVPCIVVSQGGEETVSFGRKDMRQLLDLL
jgi:thioredoxin reductase (NADPH)